MNLITNAIKYNDKPEKHITIGYEDLEPGKPYVFYVKDNGIGYNPEQIKSNSLGLTIVKTYVYEKLAGKLVIETGNEGTTTSFAFKL